MRVVSSRPNSLNERVAALEEGRKATEDRLLGIETKLAEIYNLLMMGRGVRRFISNMFSAIGVLGTIGVAAITVWKFFFS